VPCEQIFHLDFYLQRLSMSWKNFFESNYIYDKLEWVEPLYKTMECLVEVLSYVEKLEQYNSIFASFDREKFNRSINKAVKSYLDEANKLILTLLSFHPNASMHSVTGKGWRDEREYKKEANKPGRSRKPSPDIPGLDSAIGSIRDIGRFYQYMPRS
jgi:hypothetical protein